jgi:hypothetical protein
MDRATKAAIVIFVVVVLLMLMLAAYGYFGGAWDSLPP